MESSTIAGLGVGFLCLYELHRLSQYESIAPKGLPWVGRREEIFPYLRTKFRSVFNTREIMIEAYFQFNKVGRAVILAFPLGRPQVILPLSSIRWIIMQPDRVLSPTPIHDEVGQPAYAFQCERLQGDHTVYTLLRRDLAKNLTTLIPIISEEICDSLDDTWGLDTEWKPIAVDDTIREIVTRTVNRMLVGKALCRDEDYNLSQRKLTLSCIPSALVLNAFPDWLKPTASKLTTIVSRIYVERCMRYLNPMFTQRIADAEALKKDPNSRAPLPNDLITWAVNDALDRGEAREGLERLLIARLFMVNFAAVETSTATITNTLYDLFTMAPEENFAEAVQGEALSVFKDVGDPPNKEDVLKLVRIDSAIKETLRQRTIFVALQRQVVDPNGVTTDEGLYLPGGSRLAISAIGVHNDDDYWADATRYDAFRHCQISKETTENSKADSGKAENGQPNPLQTFSHSLAAASEHYMPFGLGRHSCPGRTFAADEMKLIIGHIFQRYDIKYVGQQRVGTTPIANLNADILIRRRPETLPTRAK